MIIQKTVGLVAAPFSPMQPDGSLNLDAVAPYAQWLHDGGVVGAFICGTTGEGMSLSTDERRQLAERWVAVSPAGLRVMVHVGHTSLRDSCDLAAHAQSIGAACIACMSPFFLKPNGVLGLVQWCQQVAAAASELPFYFYHIPSMTGVHVDVSEFLRLACPVIPNLAGVKFTFEDLDDYQRCLETEAGRFDVLFGRDEILHTALKLGARGAVGSTYNFSAALYRELIQAFESGDQAKAAELQQVAVGMIDAFLQCGGHPTTAFKSFMSKVAVDCGPPRLPLSPLSKEQEDRFQAGLRDCGIDRWV